MKTLLLTLALFLSSTVISSDLPVAIKVFGDSWAGSAETVTYKNKIHIITVYHVCYGATNLVQFDKNRFTYFKIIKLNARLHMCELAGPVTSRVLSLADSDKQNGLAIGYPGLSFSLVGVSLTFVKMILLPMNLLIPSSLFLGKIFPGMSGGPVVNQKLEVIGLNMAGDETHSLLVPVSMIKVFLDNEGDK